MSNRWVRFTSPKVVDAGVTESGNSGQRKYVLIRAGDGWIIAVTEMSYSGPDVEGYVETWTTEWYRNIVSSITAQIPKERVSPIHLNLKYTQRINCGIMLGVIALLFVAGAWLTAGGADESLRAQRRAG